MSRERSRKGRHGLDGHSGREAGPTQYKVGYKRPPVSTRFKAGRSGNPKGRPKG